MRVFWCTVKGSSGAAGPALGAAIPRRLRRAQGRSHRRVLGAKRVEAIGEALLLRGAGQEGREREHERQARGGALGASAGAHGAAGAEEGKQPSVKH